jgi:hypothetical protein
VHDLERLCARHSLRFTAVMAAGSIVGALLGGLAVGLVSNLVLVPMLAAVLLVSAAMLARH